MNTLLLAVQDTVNQMIDSTNVAATTVATAPKELRFIDLLFAGGWVMIPLALLAFLGLVIFIERYLTIRKVSKDETTDICSRSDKFSLLCRHLVYFL